MIERLLGYNECRLQLLHQPEPIRASRIAAEAMEYSLIDKVLARRFE